MSDSEIVHHDSSIEVHASVLDVIARAASDPTVNVEKLERLLAIQERLLADKRKTAYFAALARLQAAIPQITKAGSILDRDGKARNKYAKIEDIDVAIRPLCAAEGFSFSFDSKPLPGAAGSEYSCAMQHRDGHVEVKTLALPVDQGAGRNAVQSAGSSISYAKRYLLGMHLHIVTRDEDDDGNGRAPITLAQSVELREALREAGGDEGKFLRYCNAESFEDIRADKLAAARALIEEKKRQAKR